MPLRKLKHRPGYVAPPRRERAVRISAQEWFTLAEVEAELSCFSPLTIAQMIADGEIPTENRVLVPGRRAVLAVHRSAIERLILRLPLPAANGRAHPAEFEITCSGDESAG